MTPALATRDTAQTLEAVLVNGDLSRLSAAQRVEYYAKVCESAGLNPLTRPFDYLVLNGKTVLYAKKDATDQLRMIHKISVVDMAESEREGVFTVTVKVQNAEGRTDMDKGAVRIEGLKGEALANALMKAATKAKRRATLSICGLGLLDETEVDSIPNAHVVAVNDDAPAGRRTNVITNPETGKKIDTENARNQRPEWDRFTDTVQGYVEATNAEGLRQWFTSEKTAKFVAGWVFKDQAEEHFEAALDAIEKAERA